MKRCLLAAFAAVLVFCATASARPTVKFSWSPGTPAAGRTVAFDASRTRCDHRPCSYRWRAVRRHGSHGKTRSKLFGTGRHLKHKFKRRGAKRVRLTVRNARGRRASATRTVGVRARGSARDRDGDGVRNRSDRCPKRRGPASRHGCPVTRPAAAKPPVAAPPAPAPSNGRNCIRDPSACGYPDLENTGTLPWVPREAATGTVTLSTPGQIYQNKTLVGGIVVTAPNVLIRNVKVIQNAFFGITVRNTSGVRIEDSEVNMNGHLDGSGIVTEGYTATRVFLHNGADCASLWGNTATVQDSLCVIGPDVNNDALPDNRSFCTGGSEHWDGLQSDGGNNLTIRHNTIRNPCGQTSAIIIGTNTEPIRDVSITDNLLDGGGYTLYCNAGPAVGGTEVVTGNRFARTYWPQGGYYGPASYCRSVANWSNNVWDDTLQPIPR
jgi:hypothetical protein